MSLPIQSFPFADSPLQMEQAESCPASLAQRRLWFLEQLHGGTPVYNVDVGLWLYGRLNLSALESSLQEVVNRHESLRTTFRLQGGEVLQVVAPTLQVTLPVEDFTKLSDPLQSAYTLARREVATPFDLSTGPLLRAKVIRVAPEEHIFLCTMHHTITDAWSMQLFVKELGVAYEAASNEKPCSLPQLPIQYGDFSEWQQESFATEIAQQQLDYWKHTLAGAPPVLELPLDRPRAAEQTFDGATQTSAVPDEVVGRIRALASRQQATPFMLFLAAFKTLLYRYSGEPDVIVGVPVAGRNAVETETLIGLFVNSLALRSDLRGNPRFVDLLAQVRETTLTAFSHADVPFEKVVEALQPERNLSHNPIFQVMCSSIKSAVGTRDFGNLKVFPYVVDRSTSVLDLNVTLVEWLDGRWWIQIDYNTALFDAATINRLQEHFQTLLAGIAVDPQQRIGDLPLLTAAEERKLVVDFNNTSADFRRDLCLHQFFEQQVTRTPDAIAVISGHERISYHELNERAGRLASELRRRGVASDVPVGLCADRSVHLLVGILAVLKAGGAYVPLDPEYPRGRLRLMLEQSGSRLLLTPDKFKEKFAGENIDFIDPGGKWPISDLPQSDKSPRPDSLAYILFTSGSTGRPKAVAVEHRNATNFVQWARTVFSREELAGTLCATSMCFDLSIFEMFVPWSAGGTVILAPNALSLPELPAARDVTLINTVPSIMAELLGSGGVPDSVLTVNLAGEALSGALVRDLYARTPVKVVCNLYGPTEATTYATYAWIGRNADVTIGKPIANTQAYILDRNSKLVPQGGLGELYLGGAGLARGYFGQPEFTAERFVANPFSTEPGARLYRTGDLCRQRSDGSIEYLGRLDQQVKVRGFRIELGEIEATLEKHDSVRQAIAAVYENAGDRRLVAYITAKPDRLVQIPELHRHLETTLPGYMVPRAFVVMAEFPRTLNGKVDHRALPAPEGVRDSTAVAPRDQMEEALVKIWESVLNVRPIGVTDNFFDLGGHSLMAARLIAQIHSTTGKQIPLSSIFRAPTVEGLARVLASEQVAKPDPILMQLSSGNSGIPFFAIAAPGVDSLGLALLARQLENHAVYKIQDPGPIIADRPMEKEELKSFAREYVAAMRAVQPHGPYCLGGMCDGVHIGQHIIMELESQGEEVALFAIFDTWVWENSQIRPLWMFEYYLQRFRSLPNLPVREVLSLAGKVLGRSLKQSGWERSAWQKLYWPGSDFQAPRFQAPIVLFKRPRQPYYYTRDPQMGWGERSEGGVEICEIDCGHYEILRRPHVQLIAERLSNKLDEVSARVEKSSLRLTVAQQNAGRNVDWSLTGLSL